MRVIGRSTSELTRSRHWPGSQGGQCALGVRIQGGSFVWCAFENQQISCAHSREILQLILRTASAILWILIRDIGLVAVQSRGPGHQQQQCLPCPTLAGNRARDDLSRYAVGQARFHPLSVPPRLPRTFGVLCVCMEWLQFV